MTEAVYVTPAQVDAARLQVELDKERGRAPDPAVVRIANAILVSDLPVPVSDEPEVGDRNNLRQAPPDGTAAEPSGDPGAPAELGPATGSASAEVGAVVEPGTDSGTSDDLRAEDAAPDDVIAYLLEQHHRISEALDAVLAAHGEERQHRFKQAREMIFRHETAEELILRWLTRETPDGVEVAEARMAEEDAAKEMLAGLDKVDAASAGFIEMFTEFREAVLAHMDAEEVHEFPLLREHVGPEALAKARDRVKRVEAMAPTHAGPRTTAVNYVAGTVAAMLDRVRGALRSSDA